MHPGGEPDAGEGVHSTQAVVGVFSPGRGWGDLTVEMMCDTQYFLMICFSGSSNQKISSF